MLASDKIMMSLSYGDQVFWPVYVTMGNLDAKICWSPNWLDILFIGSIPIVHEQTEDSDHKNRDLKIIIKYLALKTKLKRL